MSRQFSPDSSLRARPQQERMPAPDTAADRTPGDQQTFDFYHLLTVFSVSAAMIGVCLTAIGLIQVVRKLSQLTTVCDAMLAGDAAVFLAAMLCSFLSMRLRFRGPWRGFALSADLSILGGMALMVLSCAILVWALF